jgi:hypothetical protein
MIGGAQGLHHALSGSKSYHRVSHKHASLSRVALLMTQRAAITLRLLAAPFAYTLRAFVFPSPRLQQKHANLWQSTTRCWHADCFAYTMLAGDIENFGL